MIELSEKNAVHVRFLLGPAGTGKTFRCLEEIRAELKRAPTGPPLLFLAPKQATFQIERQLLSDPDLRGYTRLQILSFDRLATFALEILGSSPRKILSEEGRVMVLRALLARRQSELTLFRATARLPGFAQQLAALLRELKHQQIGADRLRELASEEQTISSALRRKLQDVALIFAAYRDWLGASGLNDAETHLDFAAAALEDVAKNRSREKGTRHGVEGAYLWLDGFAEMTPQELNLLTAILPFCARATMAFCLEAEPADTRASWLSVWTVVAQTFRRVRERVNCLPGVEVEVEVLGRDRDRNRFRSASMLAHLEAHWTDGVAFQEPASHEIVLAQCSGIEAEAVFAAREICRLVRGGGRYRECAVLMRTLDGYHDIVRRVFTSYGIPLFLDRRAAVAHHPLAELTRFALRVAAYGWQRDDWFGALKTGLVESNEQAIDELENAALARGWEPDQWQRPFSEKDGPPRLEALRARVTPAFASLNAAVSSPVNGLELVAAIRALWAGLSVEATLERWTEEARDVAPLAVSIHSSVLEQMEDWLTNVERAFASQSLSIHEWLPILEAGLAGLSVGVIPPALDQVLVGTIDRSRNPDLRLAIIIGLNETVFPAPPPPPPILTEHERDEFSDALIRERKSFGLSRKDRLAHERYFGYIACTRSCERLVLTWSHADRKGRALNPSPFISLVKRLFPSLEPVTFNEVDWRNPEHLVELAPEVIRPSSRVPKELLDWPEFAEVIARAHGVRTARSVSALAADIASRLYENPLRTSVSALEQFASCPFKFFLSKGLGLKERIEFEVDARERGKFQHDILSQFHARIIQSGRQWRDLTPEEAREIIRDVGLQTLRSFGGGLFNVNAERRFTAELLITNLERLASTLVGWMKTYQFNPDRVELAFGFEKESLPGWTIDLGNGRSLLLCGRVDRIDLAQHPSGDGKLAVVIDYKSSGRRVDATKLHHGIELQLLSYLGWLRQVDASSFDGQTITPAGVFYLGLKGGVKSASSRTDALEKAEELQRKTFQHAGRFDASWRSQFASDGNKEQFNLGGQSDPCESAVFEALVNDVETHLRQFGRRILEGAIEIAPYRKGKEVACTQCEFSSICRFDAWTQPYRVLAAPPRPPVSTLQAGKGRAQP